MEGATVSWEPIDLVKLEERPRIAPTVGGVGLVYPGKRHVFSGPPESAKTLAAYAIALQEIRRGGDVLLIDFEMGPWDARDRLREMGATDLELARIPYVEPEHAATDGTASDVLEHFPLSLVLIDAAAGGYSLQGLNDNDRTDVETFMRLYVSSFSKRGVASILIDHVGKAVEKRGRFAIGSERKIGFADVHLGFETVVPLQRGRRGLFKITTHKDRLGHLHRPKAAELELRSDPATHELTWTFREPDEASIAGRWRPTVYMERVSKFLEKQRDEVSRAEVERNVLGKGDLVRLGLDELVLGGYAAETAGPRGSRLVRSVESFRESTSSPPRPDLVQTGSSPPRPSSPSLRGDEDEDGVEDEVLFAMSRRFE